MSNGTTVFKVSLDDSGTIKAKTNEMKAFNAEGSKAAKMAAAKADNRAYGQARGSMEATGASGRDFANQAQGLGGLVRLYATYAANLFAVSAAFSALRDAMSTDIMIRGLDQLGAASGVSMGSLAKQFAAASGGAISLREAMESTAKAVSSGLSSAQFMELGKVAKGASQALGVNMSDAVSRLTRGITKLEPELLDELGIFTKVGKASEDYARSIGKSVSSLTDFERRQAFANAVLVEGAKKFGEIALQSNPYDKLLASLKDTAQSILSIVNTVIAPIAKLLADNTGLITASLALMGVKIAQQALPALVSWQKGLTAAAAVSADKLGQLVNPEGFVERTQAKFNIPKLEAEVRNAEKIYAAAAQKFIQTENNYKSKSAPLLKTLASGVTLEGGAYVNAVKQVSKSTDDLSAAELRHISSLRETIKASDALADSRKRLAASNDLVQAAADAPLTAREKAQQSRYKEAAGTRDRLTILAGVGADYDREGFTKSIKNANEAAKQSTSLSKFGQIVTTVQAAGVAGAKSLSLFGGRILSFIPLLGALYTAYEILNAIYSDNSKEAATFRGTLEQLAETAKTNTNVFEKFGNTLSVESLNAKATAFGDLASAIQKSTQDLQAADLAASSFDKFIDNFLGLIGKDLKSSYTKTLAVALSEGIKNIPDRGIRDELEKKLKIESGAASTGVKDLKDALDNISASEIVKKGKALGTLIDIANKPVQFSRALSQDIEASSKATTQAELDLRNSLSKTDSVGAYYEKVIKQLDSTKKGLEDATTASTEFQKIASGDANVNFLGTAGAAQLTDLSNAYVQFAQNIKSNSDNLQQNKDRLLAIEQQLQSKLLYTSVRNELNREADKIRSLIGDQTSQLNKNKAQIVDLATQAKTIFQAAYTQAFDNAIASAGRKMQISNLQFAKNVLASSPTQTPESLKQQFELDKQMLKLKQLEITSQYDLIDALERTTANQKIVDLEKQLEGASRDPAFRQNLQEQLGVEKAKLRLIGGTASSEDMKALRSGGPGSEAVGLVNRNAARRAAAQQTSNDLKMLGITLNKSIEDLGFKELTSALNAQKTAEEQRLESIKRSPEYLAASDSERMKLVREQLDRINQISANLATAPAAQNLAQTKVSGNAGQIEKAQSELGTSQVSALTGLRLAGEKLTQDTITAQGLENLTLAGKLYKDYFAGQTRSLEVAKSDLEYKSASLEYDFKRGDISEDEFNSKKYLIAVEQAGLVKSIALLSEEEKVTGSILDIQRKIVESGGVASPAMQEGLAEAETGNLRVVDAINRQYDSTEKLLYLNKDLATRQVSYEEVFKNSFNNMAEAIVNFTKTGKFSFKDLANSMLEEILRIELRMQTSQMWSALRPSISAGITSFFTPSAVNTTIPMQPGGGYAKGGAFDSGVEAFAKGGAFTNSVVNSPTMFKFAKGTGLMGEAGPEAIMPLKRDANGNLGVRSGNSQANVDVVVNNYSTAPATAKETTDSRGNRKIEVTIGDMIAQEVSRTGSNMQQAMTSTYGNRPALARR